MKHEVSHVSRDSPKLITFLLNQPFVSDREQVILILLFRVQTLVSSHSILFFLLLRSKVADFPEYGNQITLSDLRIPLYNQLIDPIKTSIVEVVTLPRHLL